MNATEPDAEFLEREQKWVSRFKDHGAEFLEKKFRHIWIDQSDMIREYLEIFLEDQKDCDDFRGLVAEEEMSLISMRKELFKGNSVQDVQKHFSQTQLDSWRDQVQINISKDNKRRFSVDEPVLIKMELKNIPNLEIKIFEINTLNFCQSKGKNFDNRIDLAGLVPKWVHKKEFSQNKPIVKWSEDFLFPEIDRRGVFIIQFLSKGWMSEAVIHKGALSIVPNQTDLGIEYYVVNETGALCKGPDTCIYIDNKQWPCDQETGAILVAFADHADRKPKMVAYHQGFAYQHKVAVPEEKFNFKAEFLYNPGNVRPGFECTVLFHAKLFLNDKITLLQRIKNPVIEVITTNASGVPSSKFFRNFELTNYEDYEIKFLMPPKTSAIDFKFTGMVEQQIGGTNPLNAQKKITIDRFEGTNLRMFSVYLANQESGYVLKCLGKNGEPISQEGFRVQFTTKFKKNKVYVYSNFDKNGLFWLGDLKDILSLEV